MVDTTGSALMMWSMGGRLPAWPHPSPQASWAQGTKRPRATTGSWTRSRRCGGSTRTWGTSGVTPSASPSSAPAPAPPASASSSSPTTL